jgi:hypothetical protein
VGRAAAGSPAGVVVDEDSEIIQSFFAGLGGNNSVVLAEKVQSVSREKPAKTTEKQKRENDDDWRFEIKRKRRDAGRKNTGSTAKASWYYWVIRVRKSDGATLYYGTLDILDADNPQRLAKYWQRSRTRKVGKNA